MTATGSGGTGGGEADAGGSGDADDAGGVARNSGAAGGAGPAGTGDREWAAFLAARPAYLTLLGDTIARGVARRDTAHPAFHGCVDWHSAVHGTYALLAISRLTGDARYRKAALAAVGDAHRLAAEEGALRGGRLAEEVPYGLAWALHLDLEAARSGLSMFHRIGRAARDLLVAHLTAVGGRLSGLRSPTYPNTLWPAAALHSWAAHFADGTGLGVAAEIAAALSPSNLATLSAVTAPDGFLSPAHLAVLFAWRAGIPHPKMITALDAVRRAGPLTADDITSARRAGLNFSMAWGAHAAWTMTGDPTFRDVFRTLVHTHIGLPGYWADDYHRHAHWVAQFGVFAIAMT